jgi:hypothetical protein
VALGSDAWTALTGLSKAARRAWLRDHGSAT